MWNIIDIVKIIAIPLLGYLLGSVNTSIIVGKIYGIDIRKHGSGNAGMTNTLRTLGKLPAILVILGDILKGIISCLIGMYIMGEIGLMLGGVAAILGHILPLYFGFKGGKGVLTSLAVILMMDYQLGLILLGIFLVILLITRYVSLSSMISAALFPLTAYIYDKTTTFIVFSILVAILLIFMHRANIKRLINGTESKIGQKAKKEEV